MNTAALDVKTEITQLIARARLAQNQIADYTQAQVDQLTTAIAWQIVQPDHSNELALKAVQEGGFGNFADKVSKIRNRILGTLADISGLKTVGIIEELPDRGLQKIAKPVGVVAALIPTTGPDATPPLKTLLALKGRNAIIVAAHPRTQNTTELAVNFMRMGCRKVGAPEDLVQCIKHPALSKTQELMRQADLVVATGGVAMVKAAYSSGTPAYGVGVGNSVHVIDNSADLDDAAACVVAAKTFDYATSCLADNALVVHTDIYEHFLQLLRSQGGHVCSEEEKQRLQKIMWPQPGTQIPTIDVIAKSALNIAALAGIEVASNCRFLLIEEHSIGPEHPFSGEKLSVVLSLFRYKKDIEQAVKLVNAITDYQGHGHTCGIHSQTEANIMTLAMATKTARVMVNQSLNEGAGSPRNGLPYTLSLSCGTWGGNITTENVNARHFINTTWVSRPLAKRRDINEQQLFSDYWSKFGQ